jgi:hypothetical protein
MEKKYAEIEETMDYDVFQKHEANRGYDEKHVKKLMESISDRNLLRSHPIVVDKNFIIIDGQHRKEAARRLGIPITYIIDEETEIQDVIPCNTKVKTWTIVDFLNYYVQQKFPEYELLNEFVNQNRMQLNIALQLLNGSKSASFFNEFKEGKYKFPSKDEYEEVLRKKEQIGQVIDFIKRKMSGPKTYLDRVTFHGALVDFFNIKSFSFDVFVSKLSYKLDMIRPCSRQCDYVNLFKDIYNWKNQKPITME